MWSIVAQRVTHITPPEATPDQLWQRGEAVWSAVPKENIKSLFESITRLDNLKTQHYISQFLRLVTVPYLRGLGYIIFQQDNSRILFACLVLSNLNAQGVQPLPKEARSPNLSPIGNIWSWVAERLSFHR
ncbi:hypothetical protein TNCV_3557521 [Trichonephila clavipes]|uniref:Uncharacterized protein n=1 Tax=Trichonephila clavipes TaxID=2585209 RepID=A0A8X6WCE5_TRICX|nr:hypothetical protein TNCV_3557521 [Trichonephila clavipes]